MVAVLCLETMPQHMKNFYIFLRWPSPSSISKTTSNYHQNHDRLGKEL